MTTPAEPATGAPAPETGEPSTEQQPTGQPETGQDGTGTSGTDWASMFEGMTPEQVKERLDHSRTWEKRAKANKAKLDELTAKATPKDGEPNLDDLQKRLSETDAARQAAEERAVELAYTNTVHRLAGKAGADAEALLDSSSFRDAVSEELGEDFDDEDLAAAVEKVAKTFAKQRRFAGTRPAPPRGSGEFSGSPGGGQPITEEQLARMSPEQITAALEKGELKHLL